jgi:hypothetical protein
MTPTPQLRPYADFVKAMALSESSDNYATVNEFGYLGRYQFGLARLSDFGLCERIPGTAGMGNKCFRWRLPFSQDVFLTSCLLQDTIFNMHVGDLHKIVIWRYQKYLGRDVDNTLVTTSGAVACMHLLGEGGLMHFVAGEDSTDANGTAASDYVRKFAGYLIPDDLPGPKSVNLEALCGKP